MYKITIVFKKYSYSISINMKFYFFTPVIVKTLKVFIFLWVAKNNIKEDKKVPQGMLYVPVSIWANQITGMEDDELIFKNIKIKVESTNEPVMEFKELISKIKTTKS